MSAPGSPAALKPDPIRDEIARLGDLDLDALRLRWRKLFRASAPPHLPRSLLLRIIAYRIQANAYGDLDRATLRFLDKIAREREARRASGETRRGVPPIPPVDQRRSLKPGTELVREHAGTLHRVVVGPNVGQEPLQGRPVQIARHERCSERAVRITLSLAARP